MKYICSIIFIAIISNSCDSYKFGFLNQNEVGDEVNLGSVDNNVCKKLIGNVVLYAIFVDTKVTKPFENIANMAPNVRG